MDKKEFAVWKSNDDKQVFYYGKSEYLFDNQLIGYYDTEEEAENIWKLHVEYMGKSGLIL